MWHLFQINNFVLYSASHDLNVSRDATRHDSMEKNFSETGSSV